jgi:hypothetical protein
LNLVGFVAVSDDGGRGFIEFSETCVGNSGIALNEVFGGFDGGCLLGVSGRLKRGSSFESCSFDLGN